MRRRARRGICDTDLEHTLIDMRRVRVVQMAIVQIVSVVLVCNGRVATPRTVLVGMILVRRVGHERAFLDGFLVGVLTSSACSRAVRTSSRTWSSASE